MILNSVSKPYLLRRKQFFSFHGSPSRFHYNSSSFSPSHNKATLMQAIGIPPPDEESFPTPTKPIQNDLSIDEQLADPGSSNEPMIPQETLSQFSQIKIFSFGHLFES